MKLALLPGDGIGPEIVAQARKVLQRLGLKLEMREAAVGGAGYDAAEDPLPPATLSLAKEADAILFGAVGGPRYDALPSFVRAGIRRAVQRVPASPKKMTLEFLAKRFVADAEALYSYEGTREMNALIVGKAITGFSAFV